MGQGHRVLLVDIALKLGLQAGPLIVGEGQRNERLGLTHKLVNVALPSDLLNKIKSKCVRLKSTFDFTSKKGVQMLGMQMSPV